MSMTIHGDNVITLKKYIRLYGITTDHFGRVKSPRPMRLTDEQLFCEQSHADRSIVKRVVIERNLIPYVCDACENDGEWNGRPLSLQLEHRNGINNDNRLENLTFLCPNCHSQTPTYAGKNIGPKSIGADTTL